MVQRGVWQRKMSINGGHVQERGAEKAHQIGVGVLEVLVHVVPEVQLQEKKQ